jgi:RNA polymerase-binding protein DksA
MNKRFSRKDLAIFKQLLLKQRAQIAGTFEHFKNDALRGVSKRDGDLCSLPSDSAEHGSAIYEQSIALTLLGNEAETISNIDAAIDRIDKGIYGICESCELPIPKARLKALPFARLCIRCREAEERNGGF